MKQPTAPTNTPPPAPPVTIKVGQIWRDMDKRMSGRKLQVHYFATLNGIDYVYMLTQPRFSHNVRIVRIRVNRLKPGAMGYELVQDVQEGSEEVKG